MEGEFTSYINFDNNTYWKAGQYEFPKFYRSSYTLPSDSTFREDLVWFKTGDLDMAQKYKIKLEELQRNDRKLRGDTSKYKEDVVKEPKEKKEKKKKH